MSNQPNPKPPNELPSQPQRERWSPDEIRQKATVNRAVLEGVIERLSKANSPLLPFLLAKPIETDER